MTSQPAQDRSSPVILLVEDEPAIRALLCIALEDEGYHPVSAINGQDALDYLRHHPPPQLIILDLMMPVMDGWAFRAAQQQDPRLASIPVIVLSADIAATQHARLLGLECLPKPVHLATLLATVARYSPLPDDHPSR